MDEMNLAELLVEEAKENQTRKILELMNDCKTKGEDLETAIEKAKNSLHNKQARKKETARPRAYPRARAPIKAILL